MSLDYILYLAINFIILQTNFWFIFTFPEVLPDALANECAKCNEKQKQGAEKVIRFFITSKPEEWKKLSEVYDPTGEYTKKYNTQIEQVKRGETVTV